MTDKMPSGAPGAEEVAAATDQADAAGKFSALDKALKMEGSTLKGSAFFLLAQKDPRTKGKTPEEMVSVIEEDPSVVEDVAAYADEPAKEDDAGAEEPVEPPEEIGAMKEYLDKSSSMKDRDPKKALGNLRKMGKSVKDLGKDFDTTSRFMSMED